ncbi:MAG: ABC transporter permease [Actinomycetaceae bacterium]|nr:ABC transporter permease [Actinomycetaceae bacterium]MDY6082703.1 ABC transporter permease [Actinomycetaceae bacterium]
MFNADSTKGSTAPAQLGKHPQLKPVGSAMDFRHYIGNLWQRRHFIVKESQARAFGSIKDTRLGRIWLILRPFLDSAIYYVIFALLLSFSRGMDNFVGYLVIGTIAFQLLTTHLNAATSVIGSGNVLVNAFHFPRMALVFSFSLRTLIDFLPTYIAMLLFVVIVPPHAFPGLSWAALPAAIALALPFCLGLAMISATLTTINPDLKFIWPLVQRFWFYGSGIFWTIDMFASRPAVQDLMELNPGWVFLDLQRQIILNQTIPALGEWLYFLSWSTATFVIGFLLLWKSEAKMGEALER